jgi:hypothetical protein
MIGTTTYGVEFALCPDAGGETPVIIVRDRRSLRNISIRCWSPSLDMMLVPEHGYDAGP